MTNKTKSIIGITMLAIPVFIFSAPLIFIIVFLVLNVIKDNLIATLWIVAFFVYIGLGIYLKDKHNW